MTTDIEAGLGRSAAGLRRAAAEQAELGSRVLGEFFLENGNGYWMNRDQVVARAVQAGHGDAKCRECHATIRDQRKGAAA
jgi:hypothetical protein